MLPPIDPRSTLLHEINALDRALTDNEIQRILMQSHRTHLVNRLARESRLSIAAPADDGDDWSDEDRVAFPATLPPGEPDDAAIEEAALIAALETTEADEPAGLADHDDLGAPLASGVVVGPVS